jgi:hypothetical protein
MNHLRRTAVAAAMALALLTASLSSALAAGPQQLPAGACSSGTLEAEEHAPNRTAAEAIPHVVHTFPIPVPYCHHFNPTADPPLPV